MIEETDIFPPDYVIPAVFQKMEPRRLKAKIDMVVGHVNEVGEATQDSTCEALGYKVGLGRYLNEGVKLGYLIRTDGRPIVYRPVKVRPVHEVATHESGKVEPVTFYLDANILNTLRVLSVYRFKSAYAGGQKKILSDLIDNEYRRLKGAGHQVDAIYERTLRFEADVDAILEGAYDAPSNPDQE